MTDIYTKAKFWKCALQVNPVSYSKKYRGIDHGMTEEEYNQQLLSDCFRKRYQGHWFG